MPAVERQIAEKKGSGGAVRTLLRSVVMYAPLLQLLGHLTPFGNSTPGRERTRSREREREREKSGAVQEHAWEASRPMEEFLGSGSVLR